ncbi:hypothetical protein Q5H80_03050 [Vibrio sp. SNU_ST1]|uniref:hypothetical protein n=1 Tax=Vibrio sp. SNU_ST1 TaxID=3064001 RepID=UPI00272C9642|nr:hypothetical protein [Vibrio sp. SNU_ST1]WKY58643.1 hypothetical protein Q5H80_03050 [Vibrio sp. SNU_ST1]
MKKELYVPLPFIKKRLESLGYSDSVMCDFTKLMQLSRDLDEYDIMELQGLRKEHQRTTDRLDVLDKLIDLANEHPLYTESKKQEVMQEHLNEMNYLIAGVAL